MRKSKVIIIVIVILFIILVAIGGIGTYIYLKTDLLKTPQQLFYKYIPQSSKMFNMDETENIFENLQAIKVGKYSNVQELNIETQQEEMQLLNDFVLRIEGKNDVENKKISQKIDLNYKNEDFFDIDLLFDGERYAIKSDEIVNAYVAVANKNLKTLFKKIGIEDTTSIPDSFDISNLNTKLSKEELSNLGYKYLQIIYNKIPGENYYTKKEMITYKGNKIESNVYTLELNEIELINIIKELLNTIKSDETIINQYKNVMTKEQFVKEIEDYILQIESNTYTTDKALELSIYLQDKKVIRTQLNVVNIETKENIVITMEENESENGVQGIDLIINLVEKGEITQINILKQITQNEFYLLFNISAKDLKAKLSIKNNITQEEAIKKVELEIENILKIKYDEKLEKDENIQILEINNSNSVIINDYSAEQLQMLIKNIESKIQEVLIKKIQKLSIHTENTTIDAAIDEMNRQELQQFNMQFMSYYGEQGGTSVKSLLSTIVASNATFANENEKVITVKYDSNGTIIETNKTEEINDIAGRIATKENYTIKLEYNESGYINRIIITK